MGNEADGSAKVSARANRASTRFSLDKLDAASVRLLEGAGFAYDRDIGAWINIPAGRVIAFDRVAAHDAEWLSAWLAGAM